MSTDSAARVLTIIGVVFNLLTLFLSLFELVMLLPLLNLVGYDPLLGGLMMLLVVAVVGQLLLTLVIGFVLPAVGYAKIRPESKGTAAAILIASGVIGLLLVNLIGGILVLIAGALVASWHPFGEGAYAPIPAKSLGSPPPFAAQPSIAPAAKSVTPKGAKYCVACGAELQGDERFCPVCGTTIG